MLRKEPFAGMTIKNTIFDEDDDSLEFNDQCEGELGLLSSMDSNNHVVLSDIGHEIQSDETFHITKASAEAELGDNEKFRVDYFSKVGGLPIPIINPKLVPNRQEVPSPEKFSDLSINERYTDDNIENKINNDSSCKSMVKTAKTLQNEKCDMNHQPNKDTNENENINEKLLSDILCPSCDICKAPLFLVVQYYAPMDVHRMIYVYGCNNFNCKNQKGSWKVFRLQQCRPNKSKQNTKNYEKDNLEEELQDLNSNTKINKQENIEGDGVLGKNCIISTASDSNEWLASDWGNSDWNSFNSNDLKLNTTKSHRNDRAHTEEINDLEMLLKARDNQISSLQKSKLLQDSKKKTTNKGTLNEMGKEESYGEKSQLEDMNEDINAYIDKCKQYFHDTICCIKQRLLLKQREHTQSNLLNEISFPCYILDHFDEELSETTNTKIQTSSKRSSSAGQSSEEKSVIERFAQYIIDEGLAEDRTFHDSMIADPTYKSAMVLVRERLGSKKTNKPKSNEESKSCETHSDVFEDEEYEAVDPETQAFQRFQQRCSLYPSQVLRYAFDGIPLWSTSRPPIYKYLLPSTKTGARSSKENKVERILQPVPRCEGCGAERKFEFQIMPSLLSYLQVEEHALLPSLTSVKQGKLNSKETTLASTEDGIGKGGFNFWNVGMEWSVVTIWCCKASCDYSNREFILVENELTHENENGFPN